MLRLEEVDAKEICRELNHGTDVFHQALWHVLSGERRFHVRKDGGLCYDLVYVENQQFAENSPLYEKSSLFDNGFPLFPPYYQYDENDAESLCFDMAEDFDEVWFEQASEYSVAAARVLLANTDKQLFFKDARIRWFIDDSRIQIAAEADCPAAMKIYDAFVPSIFDADFSRMDAMGLFHHMFLFQWLTPLRLSGVKYVEFMIPPSEGIGSLLLAYGRGKAFFQKRHGLTVTIKPGTLRYPDDMIRKYCAFPYTPADANARNTIYIVNYYALMRMGCLRRETALDLSVFSERFLRDMREYADSVLGGKKVIGMLLRGTDYITTQLGGMNRPVPTETAVRKAREMLEEIGADRIFLATEDRDILHEMRTAFPGRIITVSQERYSVSDFTDELRTISEIDMARHPDKGEYNDFVEDVTVNYLYAIYILSRCSVFIYSCYCSGAAMVLQFGSSGIEKSICLAAGRV